MSIGGNLTLTEKEIKLIEIIIGRVRLYRFGEQSFTVYIHEGEPAKVRIHDSSESRTL